MKSYCLIILAFAASNSYSHVNRTLVGTIQSTCPVKMERAATYVPDPKLKVTPDRAVVLAESAGGVRCNSKVLQEVFADSENYYITRFGSDSVLVVNGKTGSVSVSSVK